jgi:hypothetical protein
MADLDQTTSDALTSVEISSLAREMANAYVQMVEWNREEFQRSVEDADRKARGHDDRYWARRALEQPPDQVSWSALGALAEHDPDAMQATWERIKAAARDDLESGHRAAHTVEWTGGPWERAQFLAIRAAFHAEWQPRGGIEAALVDQMAQAHTMYFRWTRELHIQASTESSREDHKRKQDGYWQPPRIDTAAALDQSAAMADRFHRLFLRALRALRDLRRYTPTVVVANAGQVNLSTGPQMNVAAVGGSERGAGGDEPHDESGQNPTG